MSSESELVMVFMAFNIASSFFISWGIIQSFDSSIGKYISFFIILYLYIAVIGYYNS